jgi:hypothetical protein
MYKQCLEESPRYEEKWCKTGKIGALIALVALAVMFFSAWYGV